MSTECSKMFLKRLRGFFFSITGLSIDSGDGDNVDLWIVVCWSYHNGRIRWNLLGLTGTSDYSNWPRLIWTTWWGYQTKKVLFNSDMLVDSFAPLSSWLPEKISVHVVCFLSVCLLLIWLPKLLITCMMCDVCFVLVSTYSVTCKRSCLVFISHSLWSSKKNALGGGHILLAVCDLVSLTKLFFRFSWNSV
jgi:hypothetical protein